MKTNNYNETQFRFIDTVGNKIEGIAINPGAWFGKVFILQIGIANNLNPYFAIEADTEQDAIDTFADSRFSHYIDAPAEDYPPEGDYPTVEGEFNYTPAGNDGHWVDLTNCHLSRAPVDLLYFIKTFPSQYFLNSDLDSALETARKEEQE